MFGQIFEKRRAYRDRLRHQQIQQEISEKRLLCSLQSPIQAKQMLNASLQSLKDLIANNMNGDSYPYLFRISVVAEQYNISETFISSSFFPIESQFVKSGRLPIQCSWAQVFYFLANIAEDLKIQKQFSKILCIILYQLRMAISKKDEAIKIMQEIMNKLPYHYIQTKDYELWQSLCLLFGQTLISASLIGSQRQVIGQPSFLLRCLEIIASHHSFFQSIEARMGFIETSLLSLSILQQQRINYLGSDSLKSLLQTLIFQNFQIQDHPIVRNYEYIRQLIICGWNLQIDKFYMLQGLMTLVSGDSDPKYFQMINCILCYHNYVLSSSSITFLACLLFGTTILASSDSRLMESKKWIILILHRDLLNKEGIWDIREVNIFIQIWRKNTGILYDLVIEIRDSNREGYSILLMLIVKILVSSKNPTQILQNILHKLVTLEQFSKQLNKNCEELDKQ